MFIPRYSYGSDVNSDITQKIWSKSFWIKQEQRLSEVCLEEGSISECREFSKKVRNSRDFSELLKSSVPDTTQPTTVMDISLADVKVSLNMC